MTVITYLEGVQKGNTNRDRFMSSQVQVWLAVDFKDESDYFTYYVGIKTLLIRNDKGVNFQRTFLPVVVDMVTNMVSIILEHLVWG